jgi:glutamate-1-semialdehyde aminotransferase
MADLLERLQKFPAECFVGPSKAAELAIDSGFSIKRGVSGYTPLAKLTDKLAAELNAQLGATPAQMKAALVGSMFGWHVPGADPDRYDAEGKLVRR